MIMEQTWRWFGPEDVVQLSHVRQTGARGIVTALHHIPYGVVWSVEEIERRKALIAADSSLGLRWSVVESLPIHESIKIGEGDLTPLFDNYANIMAGLPGAYDRYDVPGLRVMLDRYRDVDAARLRENLARFLREVIPVAEEVGIRMCIHPDDPPRPLMGLPRIVSNAEDLDFILGAVDSPANGVTLCSGSLGANPANDVPGIARRVANRIWFAHLRNVAKEPDGSFMEADHLGGDTDMVALVTVLLEEQNRRRESGDPRWRIPMRPDHGHELLDDVGKPTHPGYPAIGRLKGLAELRGVMMAVSSLRNLPL
jgi:mannonate dehydratase